MALEPTAFYDELIATIDAHRAVLPDEGASFFNRPMSERELIEWLSFQAWYELKAAHFIGAWLADTPERDLFVMLAQQVEDEALHHEYCMRCLERRGVTSLDGWEPEPEWVAWIEGWYPSGIDTLERVAAHNLTGELGACQAFTEVRPRLPEDVVKALDRIIPDEHFHMRIGRLAIERYCLTDDQQTRVRARVLETFAHEERGRVAFNRRMARLGLAEG
jgi:hypothetical protein